MTGIPAISLEELTEGMTQLALGMASQDYHESANQVVYLVQRLTDYFARFKKDNDGMLPVSLLLYVSFAFGTSYATDDILKAINIPINEDVEKAVGLAI